MLEALLLAVGLIAPDSTARVAVEAALVVQTTSPSQVQCKCGGQCQNGIITHGDGHKTPCPCPPDCKCKTKGAVVHPPVIIKCENGICTPKR